MQLCGRKETLARKFNPEKRRPKARIPSESASISRTDVGNGSIRADNLLTPGIVDEFVALRWMQILTLFARVGIRRTTCRRAILENVRYVRARFQKASARMHRACPYDAFSGGI